MRSYVAPDPFPSPRFRVIVAARTDCGRERAGNEDAACVVDLVGGCALVPPASSIIDARPNAFAAVVCDGMGGEEGGEIASQLAVSSIVASLRDAWAKNRAFSLAEALVTSIDAASARIKHEARIRPHLARMGTTTTLAALSPRGLVCAQVGDSRAYVLRPEEHLLQLTRDQTLRELIRRNGNVTSDELDAIGTNVILQAVGSSTRLEVALTETPIGEGDIVLLCSDGLTNVVDDRAIEDILRDNPNPATACEKLIDRANALGGPDNVTCVVVRVVSAGAR
jgi:PPM family protein phosphatase